MEIPRVLVAGLSGGSGKTLLTVGLQAAWRGQGWIVAPFKKGPDYIDSAWCASAADRPCRNLDLFLHDPVTLRRSFIGSARTADFAVIEGNRGLHDGADPQGSFSSAELAKLLDTPVILVVDCTKATRTVAAMVLGCQQLDPEVPVRGVILNRVGGRRHETVIREAIGEATGLPVLGALPRLDHNILPERHLGLLPPAEHARRRAVVQEAAEVASRYLDLEAIEAIARQAPPMDVPPLETPVSGVQGPAEDPLRVGVFRDAAFQFYYPENLEALEAEGAEVVEVSPLTDRELPDVDALYIGGGFPEALASALTENQPFRHSMKQAAEAGLPVYAECGGAVYLGEELDFEGRRYTMAGVLPVAFDFQERPRGHGYTVVETVAENPFYEVGETFRGHEFHHTYVRSASEEDLTWAFRVRRGYGFDGERDGLCRHQVLASYTHVHALSVSSWAPGLVNAARRFRIHAAPAAAG
ncbi:MAG: cobyrinate a,c-diamide synthase [Longimicrobiales bacterium]